MTDQNTTEAAELSAAGVPADAVGRLAEPLRAVAHGPDGVIEALELKDSAQMPFLLTVQFHPERLLDQGPVYLRLFTAFVQASARGG